MANAPQHPQETQTPQPQETTATPQGSAGPARRAVLVAVDDSEPSVRAAQWAVEHLARPNDTFHFFHVIPLPMPDLVGDFVLGGPIFIDPDPRLDQQQVAHARSFMRNKFVPLLNDKDNVNYKMEIMHGLTDTGSVGGIICQRAEALDAAVVVMASSNKGAFKGFFLGSVTKFCTTHSPKPVLIMH